MRLTAPYRAALLLPEPSGCQANRLREDAVSIPIAGARSPVPISRRHSPRSRLTRIRRHDVTRSAKSLRRKHRDLDDHGGQLHAEHNAPRPRNGRPHESGPIDLKPGNILVDPRGKSKILDFGVVRIRRPAHRSRMNHACTARQAGPQGTAAPSARPRAIVCSEVPIALEWNLPIGDEALRCSSTLLEPMDPTDPVAARRHAPVALGPPRHSASLNERVGGKTSRKPTFIVTFLLFGLLHLCGSATSNSSKKYW